MMLRRALCLLAVTTSLGVAAPALAQPEEPVQQDAPVDRDWYGWQSAALSGGAGLMFVSGLATNQGALSVTGALAFAFASPLSHWLRGDTGPGFGVLALNVALPFVSILQFGIPGAFLQACRGDDCVNYPVVAGMAIAMAIDAAVLSWHERPRTQFLSAGLAPFVAPSADSFVVGMSWTS